MGPIRGRQDPGGPHVGLMNFAIWVSRCPWVINLLLMVLHPGRTPHRFHTLSIKAPENRYAGPLGPSWRGLTLSGLWFSVGSPWSCLVPNCHSAMPLGMFLTYNNESLSHAIESQRWVHGSNYLPRQNFMYIIYICRITVAHCFQINPNK